MFANVMGDSDWGHFIWLLDPSQFQPIDRFRSLMDKEIDRIKSSEKKSDVDEIFYAASAAKDAWPNYDLPANFLLMRQPGTISNS